MNKAHTTYFCSVPMRDMDNEEITRRLKDMAVAIKDYDDTATVISGYNHNYDAVQSPVWFLGESIKMMSEADVVVFYDSCYNDYNYRGCRVERIVADEYNIRCMNYNKLKSTLEVMK